MSKFPKYKLTDKQIRGIANIVLHEQGTIAGWYAEASQIANRTDIKGDQYATGENAVKTVTSGWYAKGKSRYETGTTNSTVINIVKRVFLYGLRTLPRYIDEHDCMSDISSVRNGLIGVKTDKSKWKMHTTVIRNKMSSKYYFYDFPGGYKTGVDPFGYTSKEYRKKWGDFCYTVKEAQTANIDNIYTGTYPAMPPRGYFKLGDGITTYKDYPTQIMRVQMITAWVLGITIKTDGQYGKKTDEAVRKLQKKFGLPVNGCFGNLCLEKCKKYKK